MEAVPTADAGSTKQAPAAPANTAKDAVVANTAKDAATANKAKETPAVKAEEKSEPAKEGSSDGKEAEGGSSEKEDVLVPVYRLYLPATGEHLFTTDSNEVKVLYKSYGWGFEGVAWYAPSAEKKGVKAVYRLYNAGLGTHLFTSDTNETKVLTSQYGWVFDNNAKPLFYSDTAGTQIYRLYNKDPKTGQHLLTSDKNEYSVLPKYGWQQEGTVMCASKLPEVEYMNTRFAPTSMDEGWIKEAGVVKYMKGNTPVKGWLVTKPWNESDLQRYYVNDDLSFKKGYFKIGDSAYYGLDKGYVARNQAVSYGGKTYFANNDGVMREASALEIRALQIAASCGNDLYACFRWCVNHRYVAVGSRDFHGRPESSWVNSEAERFFASSGDCYSFAAGFCVLARVLGYDAHAIAGYCPRAGGGLITHGWVEINRGGTVYVYDPDLALELGGGGWYGSTYATAPVYYTK